MQMKLQIEKLGSGKGNIIRLKGINSKNTPIQQAYKSHLSQVRNSSIIGSNYYIFNHKKSFKFLARYSQIQNLERKCSANISDFNNIYKQNPIFRPKSQL